MKPVVFVLHPSIRARAYLQRALASGVGPDVVVRLGADTDDVADPAWTAPADGSFDPQQSLRATLALHDVEVVRVPEGGVNGDACAAAVRTLDADLAVFTGGGILRDPALSAAPAWLHVHPGRLPDRRGSTCIHYGLLLDGVVEATAMLMRAGLDAGPVICSRRFEPRTDWTAEGLDHVDDAWIRASVLVDALAHWRDAAPRPQRGTSRTFFVIHPVLKHVALQAAFDAARARDGHLEAISS